MDARQLRRRIAELDRQIERGTVRVFNAPEEIIDDLYTKLSELKGERQRLQVDLEALQKPEKAPGREKAQMVEAALKALQNLREAFSKADVEDVRELVRSLVDRVELNYSHKPINGRMKNDFKDGTIYLRPDPAISHLFGTAGSWPGPGWPNCQGWPMH